MAYKVILSLDKKGLTVSFLESDNKNKKIHKNKLRMIQAMIRDSRSDLVAAYLKSPSDKTTGRFYSGYFSNYRRILNSSSGPGYTKLTSIDWKIHGRKPGYFLQKFNEQYETGKHKLPSEKPEHLGKYIGVEIECFVPKNEETNIAKEVVSRKIRGINAGTDSSLRLSKDMLTYESCSCGDVDCQNISTTNNFVPVEYRILTRIDNLSNLEAFCALLNEKGVKVNKSCGLHIHLDQRHNNSGKRRAVSGRLVSALPLLRLLVPKSRCENTFCAMDRSSPGEKYAAVNTETLKRISTIEVRLHSGSTNFYKISNWVKLLYFIANKAIKRTTYLGSAEEMIENLGVDDGLKSYMLDRIKLFNPEMLGILTKTPTISTSFEDSENDAMELVA